MLPNADEAYIDPRKLVDYSLSPDHPRGQHKARVFRSALGIVADDYQFLIETILDKIKQYPAEIVSENEFGKLYRVDFILVKNGKSAPIRTTWLIRFDEFYPRMTSCYILT